ncbi:MAG TPA: cytochrome c/FTR1 family iron permease [Sphingomonas sp.]|nr:cytochrome c/FTR1 family iron permease [Sphingomonas sp.]
MLLFFLVAFVTIAAPARAATVASEVQTSWRLLDYIAVDYREAVAGGEIVNPAEYQEMVEFSASVSGRLTGLPPGAQRATLIADAKALQAAIASKAEPAAIAASARSLADSLLAAYPVPLAPTTVPDLGRGAALYAESCASCHGAKGEGPNAAFADLDPPPIAFADRDRARDRSIFGLYQVISQGLEGTAMQSFAALPEEERWALAFHAGGLAYGDATRGERIWNKEEAIRRLVPDMAALVAMTPADLEAKIGADKAAAVVAYLRANPDAVSADKPGSLQLARDHLRQSVEAFARGDRDRAIDLALSAYLDGFEPVEAVLATRDGGLMTRVEQAMSGFRAAITSGTSLPALRQRLAETEMLLDEAELALAPEAENDVSTFLGAFAILLREGLEALLVVIAMIAFLRKAERREALPYVHGGWVAALVAGALTWVIATYAIGISGASRELTEGCGSLLAAVILLSVGIWMHGKSQAEEWRRYIATKMQGALSRGSAWFLFGLAFIVVYREVFETILFFAALWTADNGGTILAGALTAVVVLSVIAWAMLRYSRVLPITQFFAYSSILIAILAVVLAGKGIGALQEAGLVPVTPLAGVPRITIIGLFPTVEAVMAQLVTLAAVVLGFRVSARPRPVAVAAE